jgi:hypothetical protein
MLGCGGKTVSLKQIQVIYHGSFFWLHSILPHILPGIKIRVAKGVSLSTFDFIEGDAIILQPTASR